ncbi:ATP-binding protein [Planctomycetota bacterium]
MCEFCLKHGEGRKWYLEANNYSEDLLSDVRRQKFIRDLATDTESLQKEIDQLVRLDGTPGFIRRLIRWHVVRRMKKEHYGQVVPFEDVERIFSFIGSVVRVACLCRHLNLGEEKRYCYGVSIAPDGGKLGEIFRGLDQSFMNGPDGKGVETLSKEEALAEFRKHERQGLCHTVWTFHSPFIGGICNCDRSDCVAMQTTVTHDIPTLFRGEYVAEVATDSCKGCRDCMRTCQFGAMGYSAATKKIMIDPRRCFGCGICRSACKQDAITLTDRRSVAVAAGIW